MFEKAGFLLFSTLRNLRYGKVMAAFTVMSYAIGWLLPASILSASYQEIMQKSSKGKNSLLHPPLSCRSKSGPRGRNRFYTT